MTPSGARERPSSEGVVSGFVNGATVNLLFEAISAASVAALATDLLTFWPPARPPFVLSLFEEKAEVESQVPRLAGIAATGATVVVGVPAKIGGLPSVLHGVDLRSCEDLLGARAHIVIEGSFAAALVAARTDVNVPGGPDGQGDVLYNARWTFRRPRVADAMVQLLRPLRPLLAPALIAAADAALANTPESGPGAAESNLLTVLESISSSLITAPVLTPVIPGGSGGSGAGENKRPRIVRDK